MKKIKTNALVGEKQASQLNSNAKYIAAGALVATAVASMAGGSANAASVELTVKDFQTALDTAITAQQDAGDLKTALTDVKTAIGAITSVTDTDTFSVVLQDADTVTALNTLLGVVGYSEDASIKTIVDTYSVATVASVLDAVENDMASVDSAKQSELQGKLDAIKTDLSKDTTVSKAVVDSALATLTYLPTDADGKLTPAVSTLKTNLEGVQGNVHTYSLGALKALTAKVTAEGFTTDEATVDALKAEIEKLEINCSATDVEAEAANVTTAKNALSVIKEKILETKEYTKVVEQLKDVEDALEFVSDADIKSVLTRATEIYASGTSTAENADALSKLFSKEAITKAMDYVTKSYKTGGKELLVTFLQTAVDSKEAYVPVTEPASELSEEMFDVTEALATLLAGEVDEETEKTAMDAMNMLSDISSEVEGLKAEEVEAFLKEYVQSAEYSANEVEKVVALLTQKNLAKADSGTIKALTSLQGHYLTKEISEIEAGLVDLATAYTEAKAKDLTAKINNLPASQSAKVTTYTATLKGIVDKNAVAKTPLVLVTEAVAQAEKSKTYADYAKANALIIEHTAVLTATEKEGFSKRITDVLNAIIVADKAVTVEVEKLIEQVKAQMDATKQVSAELLKQVQDLIAKVEQPTEVTRLTKALDAAQGKIDQATELTLKLNTLITKGSSQGSGSLASQLYALKAEVDKLPEGTEKTALLESLANIEKAISSIENLDKGTTGYTLTSVYGTLFKIAEGGLRTELKASFTKIADNIVSKKKTLDADALESFGFSLTESQYKLVKEHISKYLKANNSKITFDKLNDLVSAGVYDNVLKEMIKDMPSTGISESQLNQLGFYFSSVSDYEAVKKKIKAFTSDKGSSNLTYLIIKDIVETTLAENNWQATMKTFSKEGFSSTDLAKMGFNLSDSAFKLLQTLTSSYKSSDGTYKLTYAKFVEFVNNAKFETLLKEEIKDMKVKDLIKTANMKELISKLELTPENDKALSTAVSSIVDFIETKGKDKLTYVVIKGFIDDAVNELKWTEVLKELKAEKSPKIDADVLAQLGFDTDKYSEQAIKDAVATLKEMVEKDSLDKLTFKAIKKVVEDAEGGVKLKEILSALTSSDKNNLSEDDFATLLGYELSDEEYKLARKTIKSFLDDKGKTELTFAKFNELVNSVIMNLKLDDILDDLPRSNEFEEEDFATLGFDLTEDEFKLARKAVADFIKENGIDKLDYETLKQLVEDVLNEAVWAEMLKTLPATGLTADQYKKLGFDLTDAEVKSANELVTAYLTEKGKTEFTFAVLKQLVNEAKDEFAWYNVILNLPTTGVTKEILEKMGYKDITEKDITTLNGELAKLKGTQYTHADVVALISGHFGYTPNDGKNNSMFTDIDNHWAKDSIIGLAERNVLVDITSGLFSPNNKMSRGQFVAIVASALGLESANSSTFTDVRGTVYEKYITALKEAGLITGKTSTVFDPYANIDRQQAVTILGRMLDYEQYQVVELANLNTFADEYKIADYARKNVQKLVAIGAITGSKDHRGLVLNPKDALTRGQMAKIVNNVLVTLDGK